MKIYRKLINFSKTIVAIPYFTYTTILLLYIVFLIAIFAYFKLYLVCEKLFDFHQWISRTFFTHLLVFFSVDGPEDDIHPAASLIVTPNILLFLFKMIVRGMISVIYKLICISEDN